MEVESDWQPIETAPKDGTKIVVACGGDGPCGTAAWKDGQWVSALIGPINPIKWQPWR